MCRPSAWLRLLFVSFALSLAACSSDQATGLVTYQTDNVFSPINAEFAPANGSLMPPAEGWRPTNLSTPLFEAFPEHSTGGWFRFRIPDSLEHNELMAVYFIRVAANIEVWWNGEKFGSGGKMSMPPTRNWNRPLYFPLTPSQWKEGDNELVVRLVSWPGMGWIGPPQIGPDTLLRPHYENRFFMQIQLAQASFWAVMVLAFISFVLWFYRRSELQYLMFTLASIAIAAHLSYYFVREPFLDGPWFQRIAHWGLDTWAFCIIVFFYYSLGKPARKLNIAIAIIFSVVSFLYWILPLGALNQLAPIAHLSATCLVMLVAVHLFSIAIREHNGTALLFGTSMSVLVVFGLHDSYILTQIDRTLWVHKYFLTQHVGAVSTGLIGIYMARRFILALEQSEHLAETLEQRVKAGKEKLSQSYDRQREMETHAAVTEERDRIYRDLHDDVGAKLLSMVYEASSIETADLARSALEDLRDTVSRAAEGDIPLLAAIDAWHEEFIQRTTPIEQLQLTWQYPQTDSSLDLPQNIRIALGRVLRESLSNALRHAHPSELTVQFGLHDHQLSCSLSHNGDYGAVADWKPGRGLSNIQIRIRKLGGTIHWEEKDGLAQTYWQIPL